VMSGLIVTTEASVGLLIGTVPRTESSIIMD
jgi:hypothetical protein